MSKFITWSQTAGSNNSAPPDGWPEAMARSAVNDTAREMMSALAKYRDDLAGVGVSPAVITAGGSADALTVTSNQVQTANTNGFTVTFRAASTNTGSATLSVDGQTAATIQAANGTNLVAGQILAGRIYTATYFTTINRWLLRNPEPSSSTYLTTTAAAAAYLPVASASTYTPVVTGSGGNPTITYTKQTGYYYQLGKLIFVMANVHFSAFSGGSGDVRISLPKAQKPQTDLFATGSVYMNGIPSTPAVEFFVVVGDGASYVDVLFTQSDGTPGKFQTSTISNTDGMGFSITYLTDA